MSALKEISGAVESKSLVSGRDHLVHPRTNMCHWNVHIHFGRYVLTAIFKQLNHQQINKKIFVSIPFSCLIQLASCSPFSLYLGKTSLKTCWTFLSVYTAFLILNVIFLKLYTRAFSQKAGNTTFVISFLLLFLPEHILSMSAVLSFVQLGHFCSSGTEPQNVASCVLSLAQCFIVNAVFPPQFGMPGAHVQTEGVPVMTLLYM